MRYFLWLIRRRRDPHPSAPSSVEDSPAFPSTPSEPPPEGPPPRQLFESETRERLSNWLLEGQRTLRELDDVMLERDALRVKTAEVEQQNARLKREVRAALSELVAVHEKYHQLQVEHLDLTRAVSKLLSHMTTIVEPMKELAEKIGPLPSG